MDWRQLEWSDCEETLSENEIRRVEKALGVRFPPDFRECVQHCHGGTPRPNRFSFEDPVIGTMASGLEVLLSFDPDNEENIVETYEDLSEFLPPLVIPFADDGGGDFMCLDFRRSEQPAVVYWHHGDADVVPLSSSFSSFLDLLAA